MIQFRLCLYAGIAIAFAFLIWREHTAVHQRNEALTKVAALSDAVTQRDKTILTMKADQERSNASEKSLVAELQRIAHEPAITGVRCTVAHPKLSAKGSATGVSHDPSSEPVQSVPTGDSGGSELVNVSDSIDHYGTACASVAATLSALQAWELNRSH